VAVVGVQQVFLVEMCVEDVLLPLLNFVAGVGGVVVNDCDFVVLIAVELLLLAVCVRGRYFDGLGSCCSYLTKLQ
jgi:NADH:ubiquinone oxidoreductase subunit K